MYVESKYHTRFVLAMRSAYSPNDHDEDRFCRRHWLFGLVLRLSTLPSILWWRTCQGIRISQQQTCPMDMAIKSKTFALDHLMIIA